jgi:hypothetical protein
MTTYVAAPRGAGILRELELVLVALAVAVCLAVAATLSGPIVLLLPVAAAAFVVVASRPIWAAYVFLATLPIIGGIERGVLVPLARPTEALQLFLTAAVVAGACYRGAHGEMLRVHITKLDITLVMLAVVGSVWPLFWLFARGEVPALVDALSTLVLWRLAALYALFRWVVCTSAQVRRCLWILLISASVLAIIAVLSALSIVKIGGLWTPVIQQDTAGRGGATLQSSIAVGDYVAYTLVAVFAWYLHRRATRLVLAVIAGILVLGSLGTGQFSAWIALLIITLVVVSREPLLAKLSLRFLPFCVLGAVIAWPVVATRLASFRDGDIPSSWLGRIDNLTHFYLPRLAGFHWVLGVRPDSVLPAPETWRTAIWLESGYLWFFWVGGIPLFVAFIWFAREVFRHTNRVCRTRSDDIGIAALAARAALWSILVLSLIDMHLTLRGGGDLFFILLGLSANRLVPIEPLDAAALGDARSPAHACTRRNAARRTP